MFDTHRPDAATLIQAATKPINTIENSTELADCYAASCYDSLQQRGYAETIAEGRTIYRLSQAAAYYVQTNAPAPLTLPALIAEFDKFTDDSFMRLHMASVVMGIEHFRAGVLSGAITLNHDSNTKEPKP